MGAFEAGLPRAPERIALEPVQVFQNFDFPQATIIHREESIEPFLAAARAEGPVDPMQLPG